jgi:hypothetical protein
MANTPTKNIRELQRRMEHLKNRIDNGVGSEESLGYAKGEFYALRWALPILKKDVLRECFKCRRFLPPSQFPNSKNYCTDCIVCTSCGWRYDDNDGFDGLCACPEDGEDYENDSPEWLAAQEAKAVVTNK